MNVLFKSFIFLCGCLLILSSYAAAQTGKQNDTKQENGTNLIQAVKQTLINQPAILLHKEQVKYGEGNLQYTRGQFDWLLSTSLSQISETTPFTEAERNTVFESHNEQAETIYDLSLTKQFRSGISVSPSIETIRTDNLTFETSPTRNDAKIRFTITVPLLRGLGYEATGAQEIAAEQNLESLRLILRHKISESIKNTTLNYWNCLAARKRLDIYKQLEETAHGYVKGMKRLIDTDQKPAAELDQLKANSASKTSARISAEEELLKARHSLGIAMGLEFNEIMLLPEPGDPFPEVVKIAGFDDLKIKKLMRMACQYRADLQASKVNKKYAKTLLTASIKGKKPKVDFVLSAGYNGLDEGDDFSNTRSSISDTEGHYIAAALQAEYPFGNNSAKGLVGQRKSEYHQAVIQKADLERNIQSDLIVAIGELKRSFEAFQNERVSVASYRKTVDNEIKKLKNGMSTVTDVITTEDRLIRELFQEVTSTQDYANALINLRHVTGTILSSEEDWNEVSYDKLIEIPAL